MQGESIIEFAAEGSRSHRPCLKYDLSYNQTDQAMDIKGLIIDSFGLEMNLRQLNDGFQTERYAWKGDRKNACY